MTEQTLQVGDRVKIISDTLPEENKTKGRFGEIVEDRSGGKFGASYYYIKLENLQYSLDINLPTNISKDTRIFHVSEFIVVNNTGDWDE
jgi:hypothetical protein